MKRFLPIFLIVFAFFLTSCAEPVNYSVDKEHKGKITPIYNMVSGLVENDSGKYIKGFEPSYIENVKNLINTYGPISYDAKDFNDFMKSFFVQNKQGLKANYGSDLKVDLSFESVTEVSKESLGNFIDDFSINYRLPMDSITDVAMVSVKFKIVGSSFDGSSVNNFTVIKLTDGKWYLHPESFMFSF